VGCERRRRRSRGRECRQRGYVDNGFYRWNRQRNVSVGDSIGDSASENATSLYGYLGLNPSVIPSIKSSEKTPRHHTVASFQTNCIGHRYILSVYTDRISDGFMPSVYTDRF
jgi:hypothetical protein